MGRAKSLFRGRLERIVSPQNTCLSSNLDILTNRPPQLAHVLKPTSLPEASTRRTSRACSSSQPTSSTSNSSPEGSQNFSFLPAHFQNSLLFPAHFQSLLYFQTNFQRRPSRSANFQDSLLPTTESRAVALRATAPLNSRAGAKASAIITKTTHQSLRAAL